MKHKSIFFLDFGKSILGICSPSQKVLEYLISWLIKIKGLIQIFLTTDDINPVGALLTSGFYLLLIILLMKTLILLNESRRQVKQGEMSCYLVKRAPVSQSKAATPGTI